MKTAAKAMYVIGLILTIIAAIGEAISALIFGFAMNSNEVLNELVKENPDTYVDVATAQSALTIVFVIVLVALIIDLISIFIGVKGIKKASDETPGQNGFHIAALVIGILSIEIFYILGGIFGLVAENQKENA